MKIIRGLLIYIFYENEIYIIFLKCFCMFLKKNCWFHCFTMLTLNTFLTYSVQLNNLNYLYPDEPVNFVLFKIDLIVNTDQHY